MKILRAGIYTFIVAVALFPGVSFAVDYQEVWGGVDTQTLVLNGSRINDVSVSPDGKYQAIVNAETFTVGGPADKNSTVFYSKQPNGTITMKGGYVYSSDYGNTWAVAATPFDMGGFGMAFSQDGKYQTLTGQIYFADIIMTEYYPGVWRKDVIVRTDEKFILSSSNYGVSWKKTLVINSAPSSAFKVAMSNNGKYQTVTVGGGGFVYTSSDYGATWTRRAFGGSQEAPSLAVSSSGQYQTVISYGYPNNGAIYTSSNYGVTWVLRKTFATSADNVSRGGFDMSGDGATQFYVDYSSRIFKSTNYGATWAHVYTFPNGGAGSFMVSQDVKYQIFVSNLSSATGFYTSSDYGTTWVKKDLYRPPLYTLKAAISDDGKYALASGTDTSTYGWASSYKNLLVGNISVSSNVSGLWTITGRATVSGSGVSQNYTSQPIGTYTITWQSIPGYSAPATQSQTLTTGATIVFSGNYVGDSAATLRTAANIPEATWTISGTADASYWSWGSNTYGELGLGTADLNAHPRLVQVPSLTEVAQIASGVRSSSWYIIKSDGTVWSWGDNTNGQLGDNTTTTRYAPVQASGLTDVVQVSGGRASSYALKSDGTVWAWGGNNSGQLGDGTTTNRLTPVKVSSLTGIIKISAGSDSAYALKSDGTVWSWGENGVSELGDGTNTSRRTPIQVSGLTGVVQISASGGSAYALKSDGTVWSWGWNSSGQLGDGTAVSRSIPVRVSGLTGVIQVAGGLTSAYALKSDGTVWSWGRNSYGQLGDGTNTSRLVPVQVSGLTGVIQVAGGLTSAYALKSDGTV